MELYEAYVAEKISEGRSIIGLYPLTTEENKLDFENWKKKKVSNWRYFPFRLPTNQCKNGNRKKNHEGPE